MAVSTPFLHTVTSPEFGSLGFLAVDSLVGGYSCGGVRMSAGVSPDEVAALAHIMTLKYGFLGMAMGGAKAGLIIKPGMDQSQKRQRLTAFGQALRPFLEKEMFIPGVDLGTTADDVACILRGAGMNTYDEGDASFYTGLSVAIVAEQAMRYLGRSLANAKVAIEGFGKVGSAVAQELRSKGARVTAVSTIQGAVFNQEGFNIPELLNLLKSHGSDFITGLSGEKITRSELLEVDVDILCPCAGPYSIGAHNAAGIAARVIAPGANIPVTRGADEVLFRRGILHIPDFVCNCGGALGSYMAHYGFTQDYIRSFLNTRLPPVVARLLEGSYMQGTLFSSYAENLAEQRFLAVKKHAETRHPWSWVDDILTGLDRKRLIPASAKRGPMKRYFERTILTGF